MLPSQYLYVGVDAARGFEPVYAHRPVTGILGDPRMTRGVTTPSRNDAPRGQYNERLVFSDDPI
jgi:hypothetical protein